MSFCFHRLDKNTNEVISGFLPWVFFVASWGLFGTSCRLPCLLYYIVSPQEASRKLQKISGQNLSNFSVVFWSKRFFQRHFEINWPLGSLEKNRYSFSISLWFALRHHLFVKKMMSYVILGNDSICLFLTKK